MSVDSKKNITQETSTDAPGKEVNINEQKEILKPDNQDSSTSLPNTSLAIDDLVGLEKKEKKENAPVPEESTLLSNVVDKDMKDQRFLQDELEKKKIEKQKQLQRTAQRQRELFEKQRKEALRNNIEFKDIAPDIPVFDKEGNLIKKGNIPESVINEARDLQVTIVDGEGNIVEQRIKDNSESGDILNIFDKLNNKPKEAEIVKEVDDKKLDPLTELLNAQAKNVEDVIKNPVPDIKPIEERKPLIEKTEGDLIQEVQRGFTSETYRNDIEKYNQNVNDNFVHVINVKEKAVTGYIPEGELIDIVLFNNVTTNSVESPVIAFVTKDVYIKGKLMIPKGTKVLGTANDRRKKDRIAVNFHTMVFKDTKILKFNGLGMDSINNEAGLKGFVVPTTAWKTILPLLTVYASTYQNARTDFSVGQNDVEHLSTNKLNAQRQAVSATLDKFGDLLSEEFQNEKPYVVVMAATRAKVFLTKSIDVDRRKIDIEE